MTVNGDGGSDSLLLSDAGDSAANSGSLSDSVLSGFGTAGVTYGTFESVGLTLGSGADTLTVS